MAKSHKFAGASVSINTSLSAAQIAQICEKAAKRAETIQVLIRLEESVPGRLVYSARNRVVGGRVEFMTFEVGLRERDDSRSVTTRILSYKQKRSWIFFIPLPWQMIAWSNYKKFMYGLVDGIRTADQRSSSRVAEIQVGV